MRRTIALNVDPVIDFSALRQYQRFMFRNVGDERRWVLGIDELSAIESPDLAKNKAIQEWVFGFLSYEMKNSLEGLHSRSKDELGYPTSCSGMTPKFRVGGSGSGSHVPRERIISTP